MPVRSLFPAVAAASLLLTASAQEVVTTRSPEPTFRLTQEEIAQGWHVLFDGRSTDAWRGYRREEMPDRGWRVVAGELRHGAGGGGGDLVTRRDYRNFELQLEWRIAAGGNSGIMYRVVETDGPSYHTGPEYQVFDDPGNADPKHRVGALYALYAAEGAEPKPAGEWNETRIVLDGARVEHWLNGTKVVEAEFGSDDWKERVAASKFAKWEGFGVHPRGLICLQDHGDEVAFRNIKIRELVPEEARRGEEVVLFDGTSENHANLAAFGYHLRGDTDAPLAAIWTVRDGVLVCKGQPVGYLYSKDSFEDFVLEVEWRFDPAKGPGNSGVLLRQVGPHKVWPKSIEAQLQSGQAGDFWNIDQFGMQVDASRTKGRNTKKTHGNEKPLGEWNRYEIVCDDGWVSLRVNGEVVNEAWSCDDVAGPLCFQSEGAEIHFKRIALRPLLSPRGG